jgi:hypothetical protein
VLSSSLIHLINNSQARYDPDLSCSIQCSLETCHSIPSYYDPTQAKFISSFRCVCSQDLRHRVSSRRRLTSAVGPVPLLPSCRLSIRLTNAIGSSTSHAIVWQGREIFPSFLKCPCVSSLISPCILSSLSTLIPPHHAFNHSQPTNSCTSGQKWLKGIQASLLCLLIHLTCPASQPTPHLRIFGQKIRDKQGLLIS